MLQFTLCRDLSENSFTNNVPYSFSQMTELEYLWECLWSWFGVYISLKEVILILFGIFWSICRNIAHNQLNGQLNDMFDKLSKLKEMWFSNFPLQSIPFSLSFLGMTSKWSFILFFRFYIKHVIFNNDYPSIMSSHFSLQSISIHSFCLLKRLYSFSASIAYTMASSPLPPFSPKLHSCLYRWNFVWNGRDLSQNSLTGNLPQSFG